MDLSTQSASDVEGNVKEKLSVYVHFAETKKRPTVELVAERVGLDKGSILESYQRLNALRVLVLDLVGE